MRDYPSHQSTKPIMITFDHFTEIYRPMKSALSNRPPHSALLINLIVELASYAPSTHFCANSVDAKGKEYWSGSSSVAPSTRKWVCITSVRVVYKKIRSEIFNRPQGNLFLSTLVTVYMPSRYYERVLEFLEVGHTSLSIVDLYSVYIYNYNNINGDIVLMS